MHELKLAIASPEEGIALINSRFDDVRDEFHIGMKVALHLLPENAQLDSEGDLREWVKRILVHAAEAAEAEIDGLVEALSCLVSLEERPAADLINKQRSSLGRGRLIARSIRRIRRRG